MDRFHIVGPTPLLGKVRASGAKNAALPALAATLLTDETVVLHRVPRVRDIRTMRRLLDHLGMGSEDRDGGEVVLSRQRMPPTIW
jgi:UDP-N-acetylglucosamine 1-carboxyvinyltransferase